MCEPSSHLSPRQSNQTFSPGSRHSGPRRGDSGPAWSLHGDGRRGKSICGEMGELREGSGAGLEGRADQFCCLISHRL